MKKELELVNTGTEYEAPKECWCIDGEGSCTNCVKYEYNQALSDVQLLLNNKK